MLVHRLTRERRVFVLERQHLGQVLFEKELGAETEAPFWTGRYLIEGDLDKSGFNRDRMTLSARLISPKGGASIPLEVEGPRGDQTGIVESITAKVLAGLHVSGGTNEWRPQEEAEQFYEQAKWAHRWKLEREAQEATESAWALGKHTEAVARLRIECYLREPYSVSLRRPFDMGLYYEPLLIPDVSRLTPVLRAVELCNESSHEIPQRKLFTNEWSNLELTVLDTANGLLDGFCQCVEARQGHEAQIAELRAQIRQLVSSLATPVNSKECLAVCGPGQVSNYCLDLAKWWDGGLWCDKPEEVLAMCRAMMESKLHPLELPRVATWTWEDRKRVPGLLHQFVEDVCNSANAEVRLEGLYPALVLTPFDGSGRLQSIEHRLLDEMWSQREQMYQDGAKSSMLPRLEMKLRQRYGVRIPEYTREPFASFKRRLRKDYVMNSAVYDFIVFLNFFRSASSDYSSEEAVELIPLLRDFRERTKASQHPFSGHDLIDKALAESAAMSTGHGAMARKDSEAMPTGTGPSRGAQPPLILAFTPWKLDLSTVGLGSRTEMKGAIYRHGKVWFHIRTPGGSSGDSTFFTSVAPETGAAEVIPYPKTLDLPDSAFEFQGGSTCSVTDDPMFEVTDDSLIVSAKSRLQRYRFQSRKWEPMAVPLDGAVWIKQVNDRLYVAGTDRLLEIEPDNQTVQILVSLRRRPATSPLDELASVRSVCCGPTSDVAVVADKRLFTFSPASRSWTEIALPLSKRTFCITHCDSGGGVFLRTIEGTAGQGLLAVWDGSTKPELLFLQSFFTPKTPEGPSPRWEWPADDMLESAGIRADGKGIWALIPRVRRGWYPQAPPAPSYTDDRNATLIRFEGEFKQGLRMAVRFEKDGQPINVFSPFDWPNGGPPPVVFYLVTPTGLVVASSGLVGHWFIVKATLEERLGSLRQRAKVTNLPPTDEGTGLTQAKSPRLSGSGTNQDAKPTRLDSQTKAHQP